MKIKKIYFYLAILTLIAYLPASVNAYVFNFDLQYGDVNPDVKELQKELNKSQDTMVSNDGGAGSPGLESNVFGLLTKEAVIKFQNKYATEVLVPAGLTSGNGFVGQFTRNKLNQLSASTSTIPTVNNATTSTSTTIVATTTPAYVTGSSSTPIINIDRTKNTVTVGTTTLDIYGAIDVIGKELEKKVAEQVKGMKNKAAKEAVEAETAASYQAWGSALAGVGGAVIVYSGWTGVGLIIGLVLVAAGLIVAAISGDVTGALIAVGGAVVGGVAGGILGGLAGGALGGIATSALGGGGASVETPFGGLHVASLVCTCTSNTLHYIYDFRTNSILALVYQSGYSKLYSNYNIYGTYQLGTYMPGAGQCQIYAGNSCTTVSANGAYGAMPGTGTTAQ